MFLKNNSQYKHLIVCLFALFCKNISLNFVNNKFNSAIKMSKYVIVLLGFVAIFPRQVVLGHHQDGNWASKRQEKLGHNRVEDQDVGCNMNVIYNPVCASDKNTYANVEALECRNLLNLNDKVTLVAYRECPPLRCATHGNTAANIRGPPFKPYGANVKPVCASNGLTYDSVQQVQCIRAYTPNIIIVHEGGCSMHEIRRHFGLSLISRSCTIAAHRYEWNPICTAANVTYPNPFILLCRSPNVHIIPMGQCGDPVQRACVLAGRISRVRGANRSAKGVVCGSNGLSYRSAHHLRCSTQLNKYLYSLHRGPCHKRYDACANTPKTISDAGQPVCGSDGITYVTPDALYCAKQTFSPRLKYLHAGACLKDI